MLSDLHEESMHFVVDLRCRTAMRSAHRRGFVDDQLRWQGRASGSRGGSLPLQRSLEQRTNVLVAGGAFDRSMAFKNAACVGVDYKNFMITGVEQNGICGFVANAFQREQLASQLWRGSGEHLVEGAVVLLVKEGKEALQSLRLLTIVPGGADQLFQFRDRQIANGRWSECVRGTQAPQRALDIVPRSVLAKDGADDHLEGALRRPPVLRSPRARQLAIHGAHHGFGPELGFGLGSRHGLPRYTNCNGCATFFASSGIRRADIGWRRGAALTCAGVSKLTPASRCKASGSWSSLDFYGVNGRSWHAFWCGRARWSDTPGPSRRTREAAFLLSIELVHPRTATKSQAGRRRSSRKWRSSYDAPAA